MSSRRRSRTRRWRVLEDLEPGRAADIQEMSPDDAAVVADLSGPLP